MCVYKLLLLIEFTVLNVKCIMRFELQYFKICIVD